MTEKYFEYFIRAVFAIIIFFLTFMAIMFSVALYQIYSDPKSVEKQLKEYHYHRMEKNVER